LPRQFPAAITGALSSSGRLASLLLVASACGACTAPSASVAELGETRAPVVGGDVSPAGGIEDAVLLMRTVVDEGEIVCTASLVAQNLAITARHCVAHLVSGNFRCTGQGELESQDAGAGTLGMHFDATGLSFYDVKTPRTTPVAQGLQILSTLSTSICTNDLAFVVLDRDVPLPVLPMRQNGRALLGEAVTLVGYGFDDKMATGNVLDYATQPRTHNDHLTVANLGPAADGGVSSAAPRTVVVDGPSGCVGDSGGPLIARDTGAVLGVYSLLDGTSCLAPDAHNLFTHVPDFDFLAGQAFTAANAKPTPESSGSEPGEGGAGPGTGTAGADNGEAGTSSAGAPNESNGGAPADTGGTGGFPTGGSASSEGGAANAPSDAGQGGTPSSDATGGALNATAGAGASATTPVAPSKNEGGCSITPGGARNGESAWLVGLVAVLERVFGIRARSRRRLRLRAGFRR
jgi:hypothetical protein